MDKLVKNVHVSNGVQLAQLHHAMQSKLHNVFVKDLIQKIIDINFQIPATNFLRSIKSDLIGCNALHLAFSNENLEVFELLLERNADLTIKNHKNMTVVHRAIEEKFEKREMSKLVELATSKLHKKSIMDDVNNFIIMRRVIGEKKFNKHDNWRLRKKLDDAYVNAVLSAQVKYNNPSNPRSNNGITHFHAACMCNNLQAVEFFLKNGVDVNEAVNVDSPIYAGYTALHFAMSLEMVELLLRYGADVHLKNTAGSTPLHLTLDHNMKIAEWINLKGSLPYDNSIEDYCQNEQIMKILLKNYNGESLSRLHIACTLSDTSVAKSLLEYSRYNINQCVSVDSPFWPGYSAMHFAAFFNIEIVKMLLEKGADIDLKNANGISPFDICVSKATLKDTHFILLSKESWKNITLSDGRTLLVDLISAMEDMTKFNNFLESVDVNSFVPIDSPLWPGYTVLHLAALLSGRTKQLSIREKIHDNHRVERIKACLSKNANVNAQDTRGWTPIHLAFRQRNITVVGLLLNTQQMTDYLALKFQQKIDSLGNEDSSFDTDNSSLDNDNLSLLHIACAANDYKVAKALVLCGEDVNSQIQTSFRWQNDYHNCLQSDIFNIVGSTPLHVAVTCGYLEIVKMLLTHNADVTVKDADDLSPLHRNFVLNNLSDSVNELLKRNRVSSFNRKVDYVSLAGNDKSIAQELMSVLSDLKESVVSDFQLSHLHVASFENNNRAIDRLLALGSNINLAIKCPQELQVNHPLFFLSNRAGETPLYMANSKKLLTETLLIERGADVLAKQANGMCWLIKKLKCGTRLEAALIADILKNKEIVKKRLFEESGWTLLHVNCLLLRDCLYEDSLRKSVDVNARINAYAPIYAGFTALHLLMTSDYDIGRKHLQVFHRILQQLLDNKDTDVMAMAVDGNTPIHQCASHSQFSAMNDGRIIRKLLENMRNFQVNPVGKSGLSIFHIACAFHDIRVMEKYLQNGVGVSEPSEFFANGYRGYTPLHLVFLRDIHDDSTKQLQVVELLLEYRADARAVDANGDTPLHLAVKRRPWSTSVLDKLIESGADINATNICGRTPLEELLSSVYCEREAIEFFIRHGCPVNSYNSITETGYLTGTIIRSIEHPVFQAVMTCPSIDQIDDFDRNVIHNVVSTAASVSHGKMYANVIDYLIKRGCYIDQQDKLGRTALHLAAHFRNYEAGRALLMHGADCNIMDINGNTAFAYALQPEIVCLHSELHCHTTVIELFAKHVHYLSLYKLHVCKSNREAQIASKNRIVLELIVGYWDSKCWSKSIQIESTSITLDQFLSDTGAVTNYRKMTEADRNAVDEFFKTAHEKYILHYVNCLCKLQYRKALERTRELVDNAREAMNVLVGFPVPELCFDFVERFLSNDDLKNLIKSPNVSLLL